MTRGAGEGFDVKQLLKAPTEMGFKEYVEWQMRWKVALYRMSPQDIGFSLDQYKVEGQVQQLLGENKAINSLKGVPRDFIKAEVVGDKDFATNKRNQMIDWMDTLAVVPLVLAQVDVSSLPTWATCSPSPPRVALPAHQLLQAQPVGHVLDHAPADPLRYLQRPPGRHRPPVVQHQLTHRGMALEPDQLVGHDAGVDSTLGRAQVAPRQARALSPDQERLLHLLVPGEQRVRR